MSEPEPRPPLKPLHSVQPAQWSTTFRRATDKNAPMSPADGQFVDPTSRDRGPVISGEPVERSKDFVKSLERGLAVIRAMGSSNDPMTLSEVAARAGIPRAAARRPGPSPAP